MRVLKCFVSVTNKLFPFLLAVSLFGLVGCHVFPENPPTEKDGRRYGVVPGAFHHRWWNYYDRGRSFADGGFHGRAEIDFREAIRQNPKEQRRVPTYGRHLTDYFPHRELGISLFRQGRLAEAIRELEISHSTEKSARAGFYLDRARSAWIQGRNLDKRIPEIRMAQPSTGYVTNQLKLKFTGVATDDTYVGSVSVNGRAVLMDASMARFQFNVEIPLKPGENPVRVTATDLAGRVGVWEGIVRCDLTGPAVSVQLADGRLWGYVRDAEGIASITVNGVPVAMKPVAKGVRIDQRVEYPVYIEVRDTAGNTTRLNVPPEPESVASKRGLIGKNVVGTATSMNVPPDPELFASTHETAETMREPKPLITPLLGHYHALIVGINRYRNGWPPLQTARQDAEAIAGLLKRNYGFSTVRLLLDEAATGKNILTELKRMARCIPASDNLLVYFAGHGEMDDISGDGFWVPVDGSKADAGKWITNSAVRAILGSPLTRVKNLLVIADSCYAATLLKPNPERLLWADIKQADTQRGGGGGRAPGLVVRDGISPSVLSTILAFRKSRQVITSGGLSRVSDGGEDGHSPFARELIDALKKNAEAIDAEKLFTKHLWPSLAQSYQRPRYGRMDVAGDEEGNFVFHRNAMAAQKPLTHFDIEDVTFPDNTPPKLEVGIEGKRHVTFNKSIVIPITAKDENGIQWISVNDLPVLSRPGGREVRVSRIVPLEETGENFIRIQCLDQLGNKRETIVAIHRKIPAHLAPERRMPLAWQAFDETGDALNSNAEEWVWRNMERLERFSLKPTLQGGNSPMLREPHFLLKGTVISKKLPNSPEFRVEMKAEIKDSETGDYLKVLDVYGESVSHRELVEKKAEELALWIVDAFPRVDGEVTRIEKEKAVLDQGIEVRLFPGLRVLFFAKTDSRIPGEMREICEGRIMKTDDRKSYVRPDPITGISMLEPEMAFIVR